jgi:hypothetical protein
MESDAVLATVGVADVRRRRGVFGEVAVLGGRMADARKRLWRRFSLRTMFVAFTIAVAWLGWNLYEVQRRRSALESNPTLTEWYAEPSPEPWGTQFYGEDPEPRTNPASAYDLGYERLQPIAPFHVSTLRKWMGDQPIWQIRYTPGKDPEEMQRLFPEAIIAYRDVADE